MQQLLMKDPHCLKMLLIYNIFLFIFQFWASTDLVKEINAKIVSFNVKKMKLNK